jgi:hypothetical protein
MDVAESITLQTRFPGKLHMPNKTGWTFKKHHADRFKNIQNEIKHAKISGNDPDFRMRHVVKPKFSTIPDDAEKALGVLGRAFEDALAANDMHLVQALRHRVEILGRPSSSSPPEPTAEPETPQQPDTVQLPDQPPAWWRDRPAGMTPDKWLELHYKKFIPVGLTRSFFQRKGQDKAFYNALLTWEGQPQGGIPGNPNNQLSPDLYLPTKSELVDRELEKASGAIKSPTLQYVSTPENRRAARLYSAARRRATLSPTG